MAADPRVKKAYLGG
ncbi:MAG: hypothetical protein GQ555_05375 [Desulfobacterales bacterium]|nr:hypothetical protein [Desulfobacterales bacterium]